eukprot:PITA_27028
MVDPTKIAMILNLEGPCNVKQLRAILGHTGYCRKFIKSYAQITAPIDKILNKDVTYFWNDDCMTNLDVLKRKLASMPILVFPKWDVEFYVHVDTSFKPERLNAGPYHLSRIETGEEQTNLEEGLLDAQLFAARVADRHFEDIIHFLTTGTAPKEYSIQQKKELVVHAAKFSFIILVEAHGGVAEGHYAGRTSAQKILRARLWWSTLHQDSKSHCKACDICQRMGKPSRRDEMPQNPQMTLQPFEKLAIDFVGPLKPQGKMGARYIIVVTEYLT